MVRYTRVLVAAVVLITIVFTPTTHAAPTKNSGIPEAKLKQFEDLMSKKLWGRALNQAKQLLEGDTNDPLRHVLVGRAAQHIPKEAQTAHTAFTTAEKLGPKNHIVWRYWGEFAELSEQPKPAAIGYQRAAKFWAINEHIKDLSHDDFALYCELAHKAALLMVTLGNLPEALDTLRLALIEGVPTAKQYSVDNEFWDTLDDLIALYHSLLVSTSQYTQAEALLTQLVGIRPDHVRPQLDLAYTYFAKGDHQATIDNANLALQKLNTLAREDAESKGEEQLRRELRDEQRALFLIIQSQLALRRFADAAKTARDVPSAGVEPKLLQLSAYLRTFDTADRARAEHLLDSIASRLRSREELVWNSEVFGASGSDLAYRLPLGLRESSVIARAFADSIEPVAKEAKLWWREEEYLSKVHSSRKDSRPVLRIALVSSQFTAGPIGRIAAAFVKEAHPLTQNTTESGWLGDTTKHAQVHVDCIDTRPNNGDVGRFVQAYCNDYFPRPARPAEDHVRFLRARNTHVVLDLTGHAVGFDVVASKPSPVTITTGGHAGSTGLTRRGHYIVADRYTIPVQSASRYTDSIMYMPGSYQVHIHASNYISPHASSGAEGLVPLKKVSNREKYGIPSNVFTYCYSGSLASLDPAVIRSWAQILAETNAEKTVFIFRETMAVSSRDVEAALAKAGAKDVQTRVFWIPRSTHTQHVTDAQMCDLFLDTPNENARDEVPDHLYVGVPVLTYPLESQPGRAVYSQLVHFLGSPAQVDRYNLAALSTKGYISRAVALAKKENSAEYSAIRTAFQTASANAQTTSLFDAPTHTRQFIACAQAMTDIELVREGGKAMRMVCSA